MFATQLAIIGGATVFAQIRNKEQIPFLESLGPCTPILSANGESIEDWGPYRLVVDGVSGVILFYQMEFVFVMASHPLLKYPLM